ncbi:hypothetical protein AOLI_G00023290 [Acnodon oligacanthus]
MEGNKKQKEKDLEKEKTEDVLKVLLPDKDLIHRVYPHQREGIAFFFKAYKNGKSRANGRRSGAILADEMGLGKSIQVILFLHAMIMNTQEFKNALLIVPAGLVNDWNDKLKRWTPNMNVLIYHYNETERERKLRNLQMMGGILLVSYATFIFHRMTLTTYEGMDFFWDCVICDEAHKLKNPATRTHKAVALTSAGFYILITGTPMQNNLREFWSLFSLISDTYVLGTYKTFVDKFEKPIMKGMEADSGPKERALGMELQRTLEKIREPFWLRRRKDQIQDLPGQTLLENIPSDQVLHLPKKNEYVVWIKLSSEQEAAYRKIIDHSSSLTIESFHLLTAVCTYPRLNSDIKEHEMSGVNSAESGKLTFMLALLEWFTTNGNFALVFSNYIKILDIIEKSLTQTSWGRNAFFRIDGNTNQSLRDKIVAEFQKRESKNILLLTTSVGAEGLTLTAADCVVFADLSWNQSLDAQAVGRAHRIGQTKDVKTYRLITCGTLEERIYRRQLFKGSLTRQVMGDEKNPFRFFTQDDWKGILTLQETQFSSTQQQLEIQGAKYLNITEVFGAGINNVGANVCGISDHGQLLSASQGEDLEVVMAKKQIKKTAKMSQQEIEADSHLTRQLICTDVSFNKPDRQAKVRGRSHETRTPGLPRKYKCYTPPFSGTRQKNLHISRPCVFDSSDSSNLSADDEVNLSENNVPHIPVTGKSEVTGDSVDLCSAATFICDTTSSEDDDGITELLQKSMYYDNESSSSSNDEVAINLSSEMNEEPGKNVHYSSPSHDKTKQAAHVSRSYVSNLNDISSISVNESFSEDILHFKQSDTDDHNDQGDVTILCNISVLSNAHRFKSGNTMQENELREPAAFHEELIPKVVKSADVEQQQTQVIQDETKISRDTLEFSSHISKSHPNADLDMNVSPVPDVIKDMSYVTDLNQDMSASHEYSSTPDKTSDSEYCSSHCDDTHNHRTSVSSTRNVKYNYTFIEDSYMSKNETSNLQEASGISTNSATVSSNCIFMCDVSLVQSRESGNKQEASSQEVKFIDPMEQKLLMNDEQEETVQLKEPLSSNTHHCNDPPHSPIPATLNQDQEWQQAEDSFKTKKMSNQKIPKLCDYSLTPRCLELSITPSAGKENHDTKLKQLNECSELNVLKEQTNVQEIKFIDLRGQKGLIMASERKCEYEQIPYPKMFLAIWKQHLNHAHPSSESSHPLTERETLCTVKDYELADLSSEESFKSGLKSNFITPVLCDYSLTPGCVSLIDTPSVEKGQHVLSECFQSTPMQSIEVEQQETQDLWKRRLSFSHLVPGKESNSSTTLESSSEGKPCESDQLKRSEKRTPGLILDFSPSLAKTGKRKITDLDKKVEQQRTTVAGNDSTMTHNAKEHSLCPARSSYRSIRTKQYESRVSSTTHEYKYGKENHDRTLSAVCSYSFNPSVISSKPQTRKTTPTCLGQRQLNICEDKDVKLIQRCPNTNERRQNTVPINLLASLNPLSCNNTAFRKAQRSLFKQKGQLKKIRPKGNVCLNQVIEHPQGRQFKFDCVTSDLSASLTDEHIYALDSIKTTNVDVNADQGHYISKEHLSTSFMQFNQFPQTSTLDNHMTLQDRSKTSNSESSSHNEEDEDYDCEIEDCKNEIFRLMGDLKRL